MKAYNVKMQAHWTRPVFLWTGAVVLSLVLNLMLFGLMPGLIADVGERPQAAEPVRTVNVIRVKRPEPPPPKKKPKPRHKSVTARNRPLGRQPLRQVQPLDKLPRLAFEINPKLPAGPVALPSPQMETVVFEAPPMAGIFDLGELDGPLTPLVRIPPVYPFRAKRRGIEGWVKVKFLVTRQGTVDKIEIVAANPENTFEQSVRQCVSAWRFKPGTIEGVPVSTWATQTLKFEIAK